MTTRMTASTAGGKRPLLPAVLCCLVLLVAACQGAKTGGPANASKPDEDTAGRKQLAYGVSIATPQGWVVDGSVGPNEVGKEQIKANVAAGKPTMLIAMHRMADNSPNMADARLTLLLVDASKILPQEATNLPQEELDKRAQAIMQMYADQAKKEKRPNDVLEWKLSSDKTGSHPSLLQQGTVKGKDGQKILIMTWYIYLPENIAVLVNTMGNPDVPGIANVLTELARSIQIK